MPLLGKVPWELDPPPEGLALNTNEYWIVRFTNETFAKYEDYLKRIDLYRDRVWTCKITEKSGLTFEEAALSEKRSSQRAECFPDVYLEPFLHLVHLSTSTLGDLVDQVHEHFKDTFVVGEEVECKTAGNDSWQPAKIREWVSKSHSGAQNGRSTSEALYKVELLDQKDGAEEEGEQELVTVPQSAVRRKKYMLTKPMIKQKIRQVATRDRHSSSPWLVDYGLTRRYALPAYDGMATANGNDKDDDGDSSRPFKRVKTYPMEDLDIEREDDSKIPPVSTEFVIPMECVGDLLTVWHFVVSFSKGLQLSPFSLDDLESALVHTTELDLTDELHLRLLRVVFNLKKGGTLPKKAINKDSWKDVLLLYTEKCAGQKKKVDDNTSDSSSQSDDSSEADQEDNEPNDEKDKEADDQTTTTHANGINSVQKATFQRIAEAIRKDSWYDLEVADKITLLKQMCEAALQTDVIRTQIDHYIEASKELSKEMKEQDLVDRKRQKEIEKVKEKATTKKTNAKTKTNGKEAEKMADTAREAQKQARREEAMDKHNIRLISIGQDRYHNRYWLWNALHGRLFVERPTPTPNIATDSTTNNPKTKTSKSTTTTTTNTTTTTATNTWGYYQTKSELDELLEFLDDRGIRELSLRAALTKKYPKMVAAMEKRAHEMSLPNAEVRRSSRIRTTRPEKDSRDPAFMTYVNKYA